MLLIFLTQGRSKRHAKKLELTKILLRMKGCQWLRRDEINHGNLNILKDLQSTGSSLTLIRNHLYGQRKGWLQQSEDLVEQQNLFFNCQSAFLNNFQCSHNL